MNKRQIYEFGPFRLDAENFRLLRGPHEIKLEPRVYDFLLVLVDRSPETLTKEELIAAVWKDANVEESNLSVCVTKLRRELGPDYIETVARRGYRLTVPVKLVSKTVAVEPVSEPGPPNGALVPGDPRYVIRPTDGEFLSAVKRRDSIVVVKGPRQVGKSSLLARALQKARESGTTVVQIDLQRFDSDIFLTLERLLLALANEMAHRLTLTLPTTIWDSSLGPSTNFTRYLQSEVMGKLDGPLVCGLDELDRLFTHSYANDVFGLFRSFHNERALEPDSFWSRFTLVLSLATESHLFIEDLNQSPFNVGTRLTLRDFTYEQVEQLNQAYGSILDGEELRHYFARLGGHPYLLQAALYSRASQNLDLKELEAQAEHREGPFGEHLGRLLASLKQDRVLSEAVCSVLEGMPKMNLGDFYRLRSAGVLIGNAPGETRLRCDLYARYLSNHLVGTNGSS